MKNIFTLSDHNNIKKQAATIIGSPNITPILIPGTSLRIDPLEIMKDIVMFLDYDFKKAGIQKINISSIPQSNVLGLAKYQPKSENGVVVDKEKDTIYVDVRKIFDNYVKRPLSPIIQTDVARSKDPDFIKSFYLKILEELRKQLAFVTRHELEHKIRTIQNISQNKNVSDNPEYSADAAGKQFADKYIQR